MQVFEVTEFYFDDSFCIKHPRVLTKGRNTMRSAFPK